MEVKAEVQREGRGLGGKIFDRESIDEGGRRGQIIGKRKRRCQGGKKRRKGDTVKLKTKGGSSERENGKRFPKKGDLSSKRGGKPKLGERVGKK